MHDHPRRLVEDQQVIVFIHDVKGDVFRKYLKAASLVRHHECHRVSRTDDAVGLYDFAVDPDIILTYGALDAVP